jgi:hypothetical protein
MPKTKKNKIIRRHKLINKKSKKNMKGGFASDEMQKLLDNGFQQNQVDELSSKNITLDTVNESINYFNNNAHQIIVGIAKNIDINAVPLSNLSLTNETTNNSNSVRQSVLNTSELQLPTGEEISQNQNSSQGLNSNIDTSFNDANFDYTISNDVSSNDVSFNNTRFNDTSFNDTSSNLVVNNLTNTSSNIPITGGKKNNKTLRSKNSNNSKISKISKNIKNSNNSKKRFSGGALYGTGYGANCYNPNFSIYNTNLTKLFPYKPTN